MSLIIPDSTVNLYAEVPISGDHQLVFSSRSKQATYFLNKRVASKAGCSYLRKTGKLRIEWSTARVMQSNYISFTNPSFENTTFYAQIIDWEYVNNETTDIMYVIDWWQTYMFDFDAHACSILREHLTEEDYQKAVANPWRRDIPELLTDEGLPCDETLETIYTEGSVSGGTVTGNRFKFPPAEDTLLDLPYARDLFAVINLSQFDVGEWTADDGRALVNALDYFGGLNHASTWDDFKNMFTSINQNFLRGTAFVGLRMADTDFKTNFNKVLELLTLYGCTGSIVGIYVLPRWSLKGYFRTGVYEAENPYEGYDGSINIPVDNSVDPKMNTFPFRYMRVKTPTDVKEYRYDLFNDIADGGNTAYLSIKCNTNGIPVWSLAPKSYKNNADEYNYFERIDYSAFPQAAYSTDAYLAFLSQQYANAIQTNTRAGMAQLRANGTMSVANLVSPITNAIGAIAGGDYTPTMISDWQVGKELANGPKFGGGNMSQVLSGATGVYATNQKMDIINEGQGNRGPSSAVFDGTKRAFVNDEYHAGSQAGYLPYAYQRLTFTIELVELNEDVKQKYSDWLTLYGYKSNRTGNPHIIDYIKNGTNTPHFVTYDGDTFTYVQTENIHITGVQYTACRAIENMFNSGVRLLKGD